MGVDLFGPTDLAVEARTMPPHWRRRTRAWIGDPKTEADILRERSPLTHAEAIRAPLLVVHGANDPRVVMTASEAMVERLRGLGRPVEYLVLAGDGHGFADRQTYVRVMTRSAEWLLGHLRR